MAANLKIQGVKPQFIADYSIIPGLWKADARTSFRTNQKRFGIQTNPAADAESMGVRFKKVGEACIIHMHIPSYKNMQLLVTKDMSIKEMKGLQSLNATYKQLIVYAFRMANGEDVEEFGAKKGIIKSILNIVK